MKERIDVKIQYPELNHEECIANIAIETTDVEGGQGINIQDVVDYDFKMVCLLTLSILARLK